MNQAAFIGFLMFVLGTIGCLEKQSKCTSIDDQRCQSPSGACQPGEILDCGCPDGSVGETECQDDGESVGQCECPVVEEPSTGCDASPYKWGEDEVLFVCHNPLPFTEMNGNTFVQVGDFQLVNYRGLWVNDITKICIKSIGPSPLDNITQIDFVSAPSTQSPVVMQPPWSNDGKVCADVTITVGAESIQELAIYIVSFPQSLPTGDQYAFEIENPSDITIGYGEPEPIVGNFPVKGEIVTIVDN